MAARPMGQEPCQQKPHPIVPGQGKASSVGPSVAEGVSPRVQITTQVCGDDAGLDQAMKSIHRSEPSPAVVTSVRSNPAIASQVYSDGAGLKPGQKVNPQVKAQINRLHGQA